MCGGGADRRFFARAHRHDGLVWVRSICKTASSSWLPDGDQREAAGRVSEEGLVSVGNTLCRALVDPNNVEARIIIDYRVARACWVLGFC